MATTIDISQTEAVLADLLSLSQAGMEVIITRSGKPIARLSAITPEAVPQKRVAGLHQNVAWVSDDFDAPLPDEFWLGEE